jgi:uncharacterized protein (TIGR03083 family)
MVVVDIAAARHALRSQTPRTMELLSGITDPSIPISRSEWTVGEAAAHLAIGAEGYSEYARGLERRYPIDLADVAASARRAIDAMPERDGRELARMLEAGIELFLDATEGRSADDPLRWHGDMTLSCATTTCTLLGEQLLHGWDIAQTLHVPWDVGAGPARLVITGVAPIFEIRVNRGGGVEVEAEYELAVEGGPHLYALFRHGKLSISTSPSGTVDCRLGGDPVTWLLALYGRVPWDELLDAGTITAGGDAGLAAKFKSQLRNP